MDRLTQKTASISNHLGSVSEYTYVIAPIVASSYFFALSSPILKIIHIISMQIFFTLSTKFDGHSKKNWVKKQIKEICLNSKTEERTKKLVYITSSYSDHHNLSPDFFFNFRTKSTITRLAQHFDVTFIEAKNQDQLSRKISALNNEDLDAVIIQAHGCPSIIQFSRDHQVNLTSLEIFETLAHKLKQNAKFIAHFLFNRTRD